MQTKIAIVSSNSLYSFRNEKERFMRKKQTSLLLVSLGPIILLVQAEFVAARQAQEDSPRAHAASPQIFQPGVVSGPANDGAPTFTPDGKTIFFTRSGATWSTILESHQTGGRWSEPEIAPFSGEWPDQQPALAPDGSYLVFVSVRPTSPDSGQSAPASGTPVRAAHLWRVSRTSSGWSEPTQLPETVNFCTRIFKPTIAADGSVYFMAMEKDKKFRLFRSQYADGTYAKAEPLPFSDGVISDVDPEIAPDESFLLFSSDGRRTGDTSHEHLYIVFRKAGAWGAVVPVHYAGDDSGESNENESHLSPDRRTLYFSSDRTLPVHFPRSKEQAKQDLARLQSWDNGNNNVWFMPMAPLLNLEKNE